LVDGFNLSQKLLLEVRQLNFQSLLLGSRSIRVALGAVETLRDIKDLAEWNIDITDHVGIRELSKCTDNDGVFGVELLLFEIELCNKLPSFLVNDNFIAERGIFRVNDFELN
jgi:hypothetical protein